MIYVVFTLRIRGKKKPYQIYAKIQYFVPLNSDMSQHITHLGLPNDVHLEQWSTWGTRRHLTGYVKLKFFL
jgi:hypothetical protein